MKKEVFSLEAYKKSMLSEDCSLEEIEVYVEEWAEKCEGLTTEECRRICDTRKVCEKCPLNIDNSAMCMADLKNVNVKKIKALQEQEVETYIQKIA